MKSWFKDWLEEGFKSMANVDLCSRLVHCSFCSPENCLDELKNARLKWLFVSISMFDNNRNGNEKEINLQ